MEGIIYLLTNQAMPSFILIETAATTQEMDTDIKRFYNDSAIPMPFDVVYAGIIADYKVMFEFLKVSLSNFRINPDRNFFTCTLNQINNIITLKEVRNITQSYKEGSVDEYLLPQSRPEPANTYIQMSNTNRPSSPPPPTPQQPMQSTSYMPTMNAVPPPVTPADTIVDNSNSFKKPENTTYQNFVDFRRINIPVNSIIVCEKTQERALVKSNFVIEFRGQNTTLYNATRLALGDEFDTKKSILSYWTFNNKYINT
ncbi:MAG: hypothetical protein QM539_08020 [Alphaproteobacteria bacterium]|nr:hypothetical protein [Alphaproteobacteria bacterium]